MIKINVDLREFKMVTDKIARNFQVMNGKSISAPPVTKKSPLSSLKRALGKPPESEVDISKRIEKLLDNKL